MGIKHKINEDFFKTWDSTMAYVLGFIYADGSVHQSARGNYLVVTSTDKHIIVGIKRWMGSEHIIGKKSFTDNRKPQYAIRIGNKEIYKDLLGLGVYPNKSLTARMPRNIPRPVLKDFVRGYFDGDGCVYLYRTKGLMRKMILRQLKIIFTSGSQNFLNDLLEVLREGLSLRLTCSYTSKRSYQLRFSTQDSVALFKFMYNDVPAGAFFPRKFDVFRKYFILRPQRVDKEVEMILRYVSGGHVAKEIRDGLQNRYTRVRIPSWPHMVNGE